MGGIPHKFIQCQRHPPKESLGPLGRIPLENVLHLLLEFTNEEGEVDPDNIPEQLKKSFRELGEKVIKKLESNIEAIGKRKSGKLTANDRDRKKMAVELAAGQFYSSPDKNPIFQVSTNRNGRLISVRDYSPPKKYFVALKMLSEKSQKVEIDFSESEKFPFPIPKKNPDGTYRATVKIVQRFKRSYLKDGRLMEYEDTTVKRENRRDDLYSH